MSLAVRAVLAFMFVSLLATATAGCGSDDSGMPPADSGGGDASDTGASDTGADTSVSDTGASDTGTSDTSVGDAGAGDAGGSDSGSDTGTADTGPGGCSVNCDCPQGQLCTGGACRSAARLFYCCDSPGCPAGEFCTDSAGGDGICPDPDTECAMAGGTCVVQFSRCPRGTALDLSLGCGGVRSLQCCAP